MLNAESGKPHVKPQCGSPKKGGGICTKPAGWRTDHPGEGRCYFHGGASGSGRPIEHGKYSRYSVIKAADVAEYRKHIEADPDPLNLIPDLNEIRARIVHYCNTYDETLEALLSWRASFSGGYRQALEQWRSDRTDWEALYHEWADAPGDIELTDPPAPPHPDDFSDRPREVKDILHAATHLRGLSDVAKKIHDIQNTGSISMALVDVYQEKLGMELVNAARTHVSDEEHRQALLADVERRWNEIPIGIDRRTAPSE